MIIFLYDLKDLNLSLCPSGDVSIISYFLLDKDCPRQEEIWGVLELILDIL